MYPNVPNSRPVHPSTDIVITCRVRTDGTSNVSIKVPSTLDVQSTLNHLLSAAEKIQTQSYQEQSYSINEYMPSKNYEE